MPAACEQCGAPIVQPRRGSQPKRFCSASCRGKAHRGKPKAKTSGSQATITPERRLRDLEALYEALLADVRTLGTQIDGKLNPSVPELRRVSAEIGRLAAPPDEVEELDILKAVG